MRPTATDRGIGTAATTLTTTSTQLKLALAPTRAPSHDAQTMKTQPTPDTPPLSVIIITLNEQQRLPRLLQDLRAQTFQDFEIIHVDSNSEDQTVAVSRRYADQFNHYSILEMRNRGVSLGRNTGAQQAQGTRLLFLDADTRLQPDFIETSLQELSAKQLELGIVCMSSDGLPLKHVLGYEAFNLGIRATSRFFPTAVGACLFSTKDMHDLIEGFDETLSLCEDCNYALKGFQCDPQKIGVLKTRFGFDPRRLDQDGSLRTGLTYLRANVRRFFVGELHKNEIPYQFGHYS